MDIIIRREETKDYDIVEAITREAFFNESDLVNKGFPCSEPYFTHRLREKDGILDLSLVAEVDGIIVGHIIYSHSYILISNNEKVETITFGPVCVRKAYQNKGIGKKLINYSMKKALELGYKAIIIFGHPEYYKKFSFVQARNFNIETKNGEQFDAFMIKELQEGYLGNLSGKFYESEIFNEDLYINEIIEFEKNI
jgi:predicted N-acetyltransferase YhbS